MKKKEKTKQRCKWVNLENKNYIDYHDNQWGRPVYDEKLLFEMLILEMFQAGLSWECILNKKKAFEKAFNNFDYEKIANYNEAKIEKLLKNKEIIRNKLKIKSAINNSKIFMEIQKEYRSFSTYIWNFTNNQIIYETDKTKSELSDKITKDLKQKGMKFIGTTIIYSYLQAIGIINSHEKNCYLHNKGENK